MKVIFFLALFSFPVFSQDYTLSQAENEHYRDYTREQLMERMGPASSLLPHYFCNGQNEMDPFWPAPRENEKADSLHIQLYQSPEKIVYKQGKYFQLDGSRQRDLSNPFVAYVVEALKKIESIPEGKILLRHLERSHFPLTIALGGNGFNPRDDQGRSYRGIYRANALSIFSHGRMTSEDIPFNDIGAGGTIGWDPKTKDIPPHIALAHEMYHAFDSIRGILDMRFVVGEEYEHAFVSEYRAVYFENIARKAAGVAYRTHYGRELEGPGVLDAAGEPRKMPSPCLR